MKSTNEVTRGARSFRVELDSALRLCESVGTARAQAVYMLLANKEYDQYLSLDVDPNHYTDSNRLADDLLVTKILSKNKDLPSSYDRRASALDSFRAAEVSCAETNKRLSDDEGIPPDADVARVVHFAREHIRQILGRLTKRKLTSIYNNCRFGPGSTTSLKGIVTLGKKFSRRDLHVTSRLLPFAVLFNPPGWKTARTFVPRDRSKVTVVPKNAKTDRTICIEPDMNIYVQLGIGAEIRDRLRVHGLDLNTQENNQLLAKKASVDDSLCTMDLSSASDLISREVVWMLLPYDWCDLLEMARVDRYELNGIEHQFNKWSSMGNGYTFELETLIFYGILLGCREVGGWDCRDSIAYGDDLIFPSDQVELVTRALNYLGFKVNSQKTFGKGYFRESCGTDWFRGHNVRPIFWKGKIDYDHSTRMYYCANSLRRWSHRRNSGLSCDTRVHSAWKHLVGAVPRRDQHRIPEGWGDVGFISNWDEASPSPGYRDRGWSGWTFRLRDVPVRRRIVDVEGALIRSLHSSSDFDRGLEPLRGRFQRATTKTGYTLAWPELGPWL